MAQMKYHFVLDMYARNERALCGTPWPTAITADWKFFGEKLDVGDACLRCDKAMDNLTLVSR